MLDRRGFLAAMLGVAVAPKDVLSGLASPAPVKAAIEDVFDGWRCIWRDVGPVTLVDGTYIQAFKLEIYAPVECAEALLRG